MGCVAMHSARGLSMRAARLPERAQQQMVRLRCNRHTHTPAARTSMSGRARRRHIIASSSSSSPAAASMAQVVEFKWTNRRGQDLVGVEYAPPPSASRGASSTAAAQPALLWNHGVCEHSGRYAPVFTLMAERGVRVYTFDVHGHGKSEPSAPGDRCLVTRFDDLVDDTYAFVAALEQRKGARLEPCVIGGQSMGGLVAAHAALRCQERWAGLVLFSAAMGVVWTPLLRAQAAVGSLLSALIPRAQLVPAVRPEDLHPDPKVVAAFVADPLIFHGPLRTRTANEILKGMRALEPRVAEVGLPLYVVHGMKDLTTSFGAVDDFVRRAGSEDKTFIKVEDGLHELLMGDERVANGGAVADWVISKCGAAAAAKRASPKL